MFWILVAVLAAAVVITFLVCVGLCIVRQKNAKYQSKIQILTDMQENKKRGENDFEQTQNPASMPVMDETDIVEIGKNGLSQD